MLDKQEMRTSNSNIDRLALLGSLTALCFAACVSEEDVLTQVGEFEEFYQDWTNEELEGHDSEDEFGGADEVEGGLGQANCSPHVTDVRPIAVKLHQMTEFKVYGNCLPPTTAAHIDNCADLENLGISLFGRRMKFRCRPSYATGPQWGVIKDAPGGTVLFEFYVIVNP